MMRFLKTRKLHRLERVRIDLLRKHKKIANRPGETTILQINELSTITAQIVKLNIQIDALEDELS